MNANPSDVSLGTLIGRVVSSGRRLARAQVALVQAETKVTGEQVKQISVLAVIAAMTGGLFTIFLLITVAYVIVALGLPVWAGFGIVTLVLLIVAGATAAAAKSKAAGIQGPKIAAEEMQRTKDALASLSQPKTNP